jgi:ADP-ribose pyrophosphatase YjhB (NUDIX family)
MFTEDKQWKIGVAGAVVHRGRVLLVRHTYGPKKGCWALPGGYTTHQERLDQSVVRELREETGIHVQVVDVIGMVTRYTERGGAVFVVFRLRPLSGQPEPDGVEVDRIGWFSFAELMAMTAEELMPDIRNPVLAALKGGPGLPEDERYPGRSETGRGFLVKWEESDS